MPANFPSQAGVHAFEVQNKVPSNLKRVDRVRLTLTIGSLMNYGLMPIPRIAVSNLLVLI